ncbi:MAG: acyl--CoA ligase [Spirochaetales bacterium]|nr:acyl--CoA ligase [Spirochaetales bacterium]
MMFETPTLDCVLSSVAKKYADKPAIIFCEKRITYRELHAHSNRLSRSLRRLGIKKHDKVAILLPNCLEYMYVYFALFMIGAWAVPLSTRYELDELRSVIDDSDAVAIVYQDRVGTFDYNDILAGITESSPRIHVTVCLGLGTLPGSVPFYRLIRESETEYGDLTIEDVDLTIEDGDLTIEDGDLTAGDDGRVSEDGEEAVDPDDIALLAYTSGTTGTPKGVMIPHKNLVLTSCYTAALWEVEDEVAFSVAPLYAAQGFLAVLIDLVAGVTMKWISRFNPNDILEHLARKEVTAFHTQPTMWAILVSLSAFRHIDFSHLRKVVVSGSLCSSHLASRIREAVGCPLLNAYGLIEATGVVTATRPDDDEEIRLNTVGRPIPGVEVKIVDENRREVGKGGVGELAVRGYLMAGYYKNGAKTAEVIDDGGWLYTGDLACYHDDGINIKIVGRCKDMVIRGGFNVYPIDVEECLLSCRGIEDAAVVGRPDDILGERIVAFVIPDPHFGMTPGEVKAFCRGKIANYKIPDEVYFVSQFPVLMSGKVRKNVLAEWAVIGIPVRNRLLFNDIPIAGVG